MQSERMRHAPMRVVMAGNSETVKLYQSKAGVDPDALAPGFAPSPANDLIFHSGKTIRDLNFLNFYVAGETAWNASDIQNIDRALSAAMSDRNLNNVMLQYFSAQPITSTFAGSHKLAGAAPAVASQGDAELLVRTLQKQGVLAGADLSSTVVNLLLPPGTVLTTDELPTTAALPARLVAESGPGKRLDPAIPVEDEASSKKGLGGYHGSVYLTMSGVGVTIYYAISVFSEILPNGTRAGIPAFPQPWKNVVATLYHELNEARTDPDVEDAIRTNQIGFTGWTSKASEEVGDAPIRTATGLELVFKEVPLTNGGGTVPVQFMYSNAVHGPEGPIPQPH
jgi:hypothetical protein